MDILCSDFSAILYLDYYTKTFQRSLHSEEASFFYLWGDTNKEVAWWLAVIMANCITSFLTRSTEKQTSLIFWKIWSIRASLSEFPWLRTSYHNLAKHHIHVFLFLLSHNLYKFPLGGEDDLSFGGTMLS